MAAGCGATGATATPTAYALPRDAAPYRGATRPVTGLDATAGVTRVDTTRQLTPLPPSSPSAWDGASVVLYDLETGTRVDLGPGRISPAESFDPDGTRFAWLAGSAGGAGTTPMLEARVVNLATGEQRSYGPAMLATFLDTRHLLLFPGTVGGLHEVDLATGHDLGPWDSNADPYRAHYPGYVIAFDPLHGAPATANLSQVVVPDDGSPALTFEAHLVLPEFGNQHAVLALVHAAGNTYDLFRVDVDAARATFVGSADFDGYDFPLALTTEELALGDRLCHPDGRILVYRFDTVRLTALQTDLPPIQLSLDAWGVGGSPPFARARVDPATLRYSTVLPAPGAWSGDGRWAAVGARLMPVSTASPCLTVASP